MECAQPPQQPFGKNKPQQVVCKKSQLLGEFDQFWVTVSRTLLRTVSLPPVPEPASTPPVNEKSAITRSCLWVDNDTPVGHCPSLETQPSYVRIVECHTCATDGCNGQPDAVAELNAPVAGVVEAAPPAPGNAAWSSLHPSQRLVNGWIWKSGSMVSMLVMSVTFVYVAH